MTRDLGLVTPLTVGIVVFDGVEVLDFCGPFEVFASATLPAQTDGDLETRLFDVFTIAERSEVVACRGSLLVQPNHTLENHPPLDLVVIPGGYGTRREQENPVVLHWIARQRRSVAWKRCGGCPRQEFRQASWLRLSSRR